METTVIIGLVLFVASEIIPHLPIKGNGVLDVIIEALRKVFPYSPSSKR
jgi:hypothetical protein